MKVKLSATAVVCAALMTATIATAAAPASPASLRERFEQGNRWYESGDYEQAIKAYEEILAQGGVAPDLYYNLGNAYFQAGELGRAVLNYERALRLSPRAADTRANLNLVSSLLRDKQFVGKPGLVRRIVAWPYRNSSLGETLLVSSALYLALVLVVIGFVFRESAFVSRIYEKVSLASPGRLLGLDKARDFGFAVAVLFLLLAAFTTSAIVKGQEVRARRAAVVVRAEVEVYAAPSEGSTLQFKIHEGTHVTLGETRPGWVQIRLPGDLTGWIGSEAAERI
jgi:tetratricopeptide (TPR) repeat protein